MPTTAAELLDREARFGASNYKPLDVVLARGEGVWVWDLDGRRYLDCLSERERLVHAFREAGGPAVDGFRRVMRGIMDNAGRAYLDKAEAPLHPGARPPVRAGGMR